MRLQLAKVYSESKVAKLEMPADIRDTYAHVKGSKGCAMLLWHGGAGYLVSCAPHMLLPPDYAVDVRHIREHAGHMNIRTKYRVWLCILATAYNELMVEHPGMQAVGPASGNALVDTHALDQHAAAQGRLCDTPSCFLGQHAMFVQ